jgi:hypothetical protein
VSDNSIYQQVQQAVRCIIAEITSSETAAVINAAAVGRAAYTSFIESHHDVPLPVEWTSVEQFKQVARKELRGKFGHESDENDAYQGDLFNGLQKYYPVRNGEGEPFYKLRYLLTDAEIDQNLVSLKKQADARLVHHDTLLAYKLSRAEPTG